jgi:hypothetical protein
VELDLKGMIYLASNAGLFVYSLNVSSITNINLGINVNGLKE